MSKDWNWHVNSLQSRLNELQDTIGSIKSCVEARPGLEAATRAIASLVELDSDNGLFDFPSSMSEILANKLIGAVMLGPAAEIVLFNRTAQLILGADFLESPKMEVSNSLEFFDQESRALGMDDLPWMQALRGTSVPDIRLKLHKVEEERTLWINASATPFLTRSGSVNGVLVFFIDTSEEVELESSIENICNTINGQISEVASTHGQLRQLAEKLSQTGLQRVLSGRAPVADSELESSESTEAQAQPKKSESRPEHDSILGGTSDSELGQISEIAQDTISDAVDEVIEEEDEEAPWAEEQSAPDEELWEEDDESESESDESDATVEMAEVDEFQIETHESLSENGSPLEELEDFSEIEVDEIDESADSPFDSGVYGRVSVESELHQSDEVEADDEFEELEHERESTEEISQESLEVEADDEFEEFEEEVEEEDDDDDDLSVDSSSESEHIFEDVAESGQYEEESEIASSEELYHEEESEWESEQATENETAQVAPPPPPPPSTSSRRRASVSYHRLHALSGASELDEDFMEEPLTVDSHFVDYDEDNDQDFDSSHGGKRVLIVDDIPINQELLKLQMQRLGYACDTASNGQEALDLVSKRKFDLIIMDCEMPVLDGFEATRRIRSNQAYSHGRIPILGMSSHEQKDELENCVNAGMDDCLSKSATLSDLRESIDSMLVSQGGESQLSDLVDSEVKKLESRGMSTHVLKELYGADDSDRICRLFLSNVSTYIECMQDAIDKKSAESLIYFANSIRGAAAGMGVRVMVRLSSDIIKFGSNNDWTQVRVKFMRLKNIFAQKTEEMKTASF